MPSSLRDHIYPHSSISSQVLLYSLLTSAGSSTTRNMIPRATFLYLACIVTITLLQIPPTSTFPMPILPKITRRQDALTRSGSNVAVAPGISHLPGDGTHGKRQRRPETANGNARPWYRARFYPFDPGNGT